MKPTTWTDAPDGWSYRRLSPSDSARITCQGPHAGEGCTVLATVCCHPTGKGAPFFYQCEAHTSSAGRALLPANRSKRAQLVDDILAGRSPLKVAGKPYPIGLLHRDGIASHASADAFRLFDVDAELDLGPTARAERLAFIADPKHFAGRGDRNSADQFTGRQARQAPDYLAMKPFRSMTSAQRDRYLSGQVTRWRNGGHEGLLPSEREPIETPNLIGV
jgi:hypothetical protein